MATRRFSELRRPQVAELITSSSVFVLPVAAVEQHGPHLPYATDLLIATAVADEVVARHGDELDLWLLEPLAYGKSDEHARVAGSVAVPAAVLLALIDAVAAAVAATGAQRLVFLNGHGGNTQLLGMACREVRLRHGLLTFLVHPSLPPAYGGVSPAGELGMGIHAGLEETSLLLHLRPDLVDPQLPPRNVPDWLAANDHVRFGGTVAFGWSVDDFGPDGHIGDPTGATAEQGRALFEAAVAMVGAQLAEVARFTFRG